MTKMNAVEHSNREMKRLRRQHRVLQAVDLSGQAHAETAASGSKRDIGYNAMLGTASRGAISRFSISGSVIA